MGAWCSWLTYRPVKPKIAGSSPVAPALWQVFRFNIGNNQKIILLLQDVFFYLKINDFQKNCTGQLKCKLDEKRGNMHIYFSHGKESGPWGTKIRRLAAVAQQAGWQVTSIDYTTTRNPDARVQILLNAHPTGEPLVLVGSSMGGYVSAVAAQTLTPGGLFLLAPAIDLPGYAVQNPQPHAAVIEIVHGWRDEIVPPENVLRFARERRTTLHLLDDAHRLVNVLPQIETLFAAFLARVIEN